MRNQFSILKTLFIISFLFTAGIAHEIFVNTQDGEIFVFDVDPNERLIDLEEKLTAMFDGRNQNYLLELSPEKPLFWNFSTQKQGGYLGYPRDYTIPVTAETKADIRYIVNSLANKSLVSIAIIKGDIEAAGDRIDHVHPLRFLETVFTDEELKVGIRNIRTRGTIWKRFAGGLKECLATEASIGNMKSEYIADFCTKVKIDQKILANSVKNQDWDEFINLLIDKIPRNGDENRYDDC